MRRSFDVAALDTQEGCVETLRTAAHAPAGANGDSGSIGQVEEHRSGGPVDIAFAKLDQHGAVFFHTALMAPRENASRPGVLV